VRIGPYIIENNLVVAPMAGVTDRPFRQLCKRLGAGYAVSEMVASNPRLWRTEKSQRRTDHRGEVEPIAVQIAGADPREMADAARYNVDRGARSSTSIWVARPRKSAMSPPAPHCSRTSRWSKRS
jgi:tRNA-dihydrouridine synthase B